MRKVNSQTEGQKWEELGQRFLYFPIIPHLGARVKVDLQYGSIFSCRNYYHHHIAPLYDTVMKAASLSGVSIELLDTKQSKNGCQLCKSCLGMLAALSLRIWGNNRMLEIHCRVNQKSNGNIILSTPLSGRRVGRCLQYWIAHFSSNLG